MSSSLQPPADGADGLVAAPDEGEVVRVREDVGFVPSDAGLKGCGN